MGESNIICTFYRGWKKNTRRNLSFFEDGGRRGRSWPTLGRRTLLFHLHAPWSKSTKEGRDDATHSKEEEADGCFNNPTQEKEREVADEWEERERGMAWRREGLTAWMGGSSNFSYHLLWPAPSLNRWGGVSNSIRKSNLYWFPFLIEFLLRRQSFFH